MAWWAALGSLLGSSGGGKQGGGGNLIGQAVGGLTKGTDKLTGAAIGAGQAIVGAIQKKKANAMLPTSASPAELELLSRTKRMQQAAMTNIPTAQMNTAARDAKTAMNTAMKFGGRNIGALAASLEQAKTGISEQAAQQSAGLLGSLSEQTRYTSSIPRDVAMLRSARMSADAARNQQAWFSNLMGALTPNQKADTGESTPTIGADGLTSAQAITSIKNRGKMRSQAANPASVKFQGAASRGIGSNLPKNMGGSGNGLTNLLGL